MMVRSIRKQSGFTAVSLMAGLALAASGLTLVLKLGPHYIDWQTMKSIIGDLPAGRVHTMDKADIRESLQKRFRVNSLRDFDLREVVTIDRQKTGTVLQLAYERRENIVANVDVVLSFSEEFHYQ